MHLNYTFIFFTAGLAVAESAILPSAIIVAEMICDYVLSVPERLVAKAEHTLLEHIADNAANAVPAHDNAYYCERCSTYYFSQRSVLAHFCAHKE
jgi:hypothetical protein